MTDETHEEVATQIQTETSAVAQPVAAPSPMKYCQSCGGQINEKAVICPKCGVAVKPIGTGVGNPGTAAILSALWTGLGQIYNGQLGKGIMLMIIQGVNVALMFVVIGFITFPIVWIYGIWDAHTVAKTR
jgi:TM2 domain-containing membrane protein YozV